MVLLLMGTLLLNTERWARTLLETRRRGRIRKRQGLLLLGLITPDLRSHPKIYCIQWRLQFWDYWMVMKYSHRSDRERYVDRCFFFSNGFFISYVKFHFVLVLRLLLIYHEWSQIIVHLYCSPTWYASSIVSTNTRRCIYKFEPQGLSKNLHWEDKRGQSKLMICTNTNSKMSWW